MTIFYPRIPEFQSNSNTVLNSSTIKTYQQGLITRAGTISKVRIRMLTVTTPQNLKISFQDTDDSTGLPDGVVDQSDVVDITGKTNAWIEASLSRTVAVGDRLAIVIEWDATAGNASIMASPSSGVNLTRGEFISSWVKNAGSQAIAIEYSDGKCYEVLGITPGYYWLREASEATNPDELALRFAPPFSGTVIGWYAPHMRVQGADRNIQVNLYSGTTKLLNSPIIDGDYVTNVNSYGISGMFSSGYRFAANEVMRLGFHFLHASGTGRIWTLAQSANKDLGGLPGGVNSYYSTRNNEGAWTDTDSEVPMIAAIIVPSETPTVATPIGDETAWWYPSGDDTGNGTTTLYDQTANGHNGTLTNMDPPTDWVNNIEFGGVRTLDFDGVNDYVSVPDANSLSFGDGSNDTPFSISFWMMTDSEHTGVSGSIITKGTVAAGEWSVTYFDKNIWLRQHDASVSATIGRSSSGGQFLINRWYHVLCTYDGSKTNAGSKIYINGNEVSGYTNQSSGSYVAMENTSNIVTIGSRNNVDSYLDGRLDDIRIFRRVVTADEREALAATRGGRAAAETTTAPAIASYATTEKVVVAGTPATFNLPSGIQPGDLILIIAAVDDQTSAGSGATITAPAGWNLIHTDDDTEISSFFGRIADGTEGSTVLLDHSTGSEEMSTLILRITNPGVVSIWTETQVDTENGFNPVSPPAWRGRLENCLWIAGLYVRGHSAITAYPSNYPDNRVNFAPTGGGGYPDIAIATKTEVALSQPVAAWTVNDQTAAKLGFVIAVAAQDNEVTVGGGGGGEVAYGFIG